MNTGTVRDYDALVRSVARRWEQVIVNDLTPQESPPFGNDWFRGRLLQTANGPVDDVLVGYQFVPIDGPGGIAGSAGPLHTRFAGGRRVSSMSGFLELDVADFARFDEGTARSLLLHEMGHALGFGTFCPNSGNGGICFCSCPDETFEYTCSDARQAFNSLGFSGPLLLESEGSSGVICKHWESSLFTDLTWTEVMEPSARARKPELLTEITISAMGEIGEYQVNLGAADPVPQSASVKPLQYSALPGMSYQAFHVGEDGFGIELLDDTADDQSVIVKDFRSPLDNVFFHPNTT